MHDEAGSDVIRLGLVIGSTRAQRFADVPARWLAEGAAARPDLQLDLLDLRDFPLPLLGGVFALATRGETTKPLGSNWSPGALR